jgi:predicted lipoprotein with Yx(FWY)xxD motif
MTYALALLAAVAIVVAGCGGGDSSSSGGAYGGKGGGGSGGGGSTTNSETQPEARGAPDGAGVVSAAQVGDLGTVLVTSEGMTLYDFHKDKGGKSACYDACAGAWPPLLTEGDPQAQGPAERSMLGTTKRKDGTVQVTYNGWPLYTYVGDQKPGEANGNDIDQFGAEWYALQPNGQEPED